MDTDTIFFEAETFRIGAHHGCGGSGSARKTASESREIDRTRSCQRIFWSLERQMLIDVRRARGNRDLCRVGKDSIDPEASTTIL